MLLRELEESELLDQMSKIQFSGPTRVLPVLKEEGIVSSFPPVFLMEQADGTAIYVSMTDDGRIVPADDEWGGY